MLSLIVLCFQKRCVRCGWSCCFSDSFDVLLTAPRRRCQAGFLRIFKHMRCCMRCHTALCRLIKFRLRLSPVRLTFLTLHFPFSYVYAVQDTDVLRVPAVLGGMVSEPQSPSTCTWRLQSTSRPCCHSHCNDFSIPSFEHRSNFLWCSCDLVRPADDSFRFLSTRCFWWPAAKSFLTRASNEGSSINSRIVFQARPLRGLLTIHWGSKTCENGHQRSSIKAHLNDPTTGCLPHWQFLSMLVQLSMVTLSPVLTRFSFSVNAKRSRNLRLRLCVCFGCVLPRPSILLLRHPQRLFHFCCCLAMRLPVLLWCLLFPLYRINF